MITVLAAAILAASGAAAQPVTTLPACQHTELRPAKRGGEPRAAPHKLNEEPPAHHLFAVLRVEDGCIKPVLVNDRIIGGAPRR